MLNRGKEGVTKKVTFKQRPEGDEGISLAGRACQEKGAARVKTQEHSWLGHSGHSKPASGPGKVLNLTYCASVG